VPGECLKCVKARRVGEGASVWGGWESGVAEVSEWLGVEVRCVWLVAHVSEAVGSGWRPGGEREHRGVGGGVVRGAWLAGKRESGAGMGESGAARRAREGGGGVLGGAGDVDGAGAVGAPRARGRGEEWS